MPSLAYRGRFAPSPTGDLHFGSLVAAVASFLDARRAGGEWLVRMEDLDEPRTVPGAADRILRCLEAYGLFWDGPVLYQSQRHDAYAEALNQLGPLVYPCACTRTELGHREYYPGTCRHGLPPGRTGRSVRLRVPDREIHWHDQRLGPQCENLAHSTGDFVLKRADGYWAYQLAVVVDDGAQGITDVVRGADLLTSTARQIYLQESLGLPRPRYRHIPLVLDENGEKLSKQTQAEPVPLAGSAACLAAALRFLGESIPSGADEIAPIWIGVLPKRLT
ncbi:MAG: tRNA glutamyl-Q(34) synthetase GluQRS [Bryobacteraceae bacterium]|nr:tRNA glutamyl-Q(34) synthetase GluQRS [Bryobacteraceae bacterium]